MTDHAYTLTPAEARDYIRGSEPWPLRSVVSRLVGDATVLEVGCANGIQAARVDASRYIGVDWSGSLLTEARARLPRHCFTQADALSLPFRAGAFAVAYAVSLLEHLPSAAAARRCIAEMVRVAGRVIVGWHTPPGDAPTNCRRVVGHFGHECWSNQYRVADIVDPARVVRYDVPATDGSVVWEVT